VLAACVLLALNFYLLDVRPYWLATILVVANSAAFVVVLGRSAEASRSGYVFDGARGFSRAIVGAFALALLFVAAHTWLTQILIYPNDAYRADMLIVIQLGIRRLLQGHTPYAMYQVPWPATLPYGPVMWAPMIVPFLFHADVRFATLLGALVVPAACGAAAFARAKQDDTVGAIGWLVLLAALAFSPDLRSFMSIGHTPAYWPLLPLFAWALHRERWLAAAVLCGLLIVARTTMIALAPVLVIAVWQRERSKTISVCIALFASVVLPLLPFVIADARSVAYAFYGSYQDVIKGFVWTSTTWAQNTVGITGLLLARGWHSAVEIVQAVAMLALIVIAWMRMRRGDDPVVWSACSLLAFSMTTLWPVVYVYFDVFLLFVSAALVHDWSDTADPAWWRSLTIAAVVLLVTTVATVPLHASIDVGRNESRPLLYAGFSGDERAPDRDYAWVDGTQAKVLVPSLLRRDAAIHITCEPFIVTHGGRQQVTAALNGVLLGNVDIGDGWQTLTFAAPGRAWQIGVNELELFLSSATSPHDAGEGTDTRRLSIAIDRLDVTAP
jgi:hypothetical protein